MVEESNEGLFLKVNFKFNNKTSTQKYKSSQLRKFFEEHGISLNNKYFVEEKEIFDLSIEIPHNYTVYEFPELATKTFHVKANITRGSSYNWKFVGSVCKDIDSFLKYLNRDNNIPKTDDPIYQIVKKIPLNESQKKEFGSDIRIEINTEILNENELQFVHSNFSHFDILLWNICIDRFHLDRSRNILLDYLPNEKMCELSLNSVKCFGIQIILQGWIITKPSCNIQTSYEKLVSFSIRDKDSTVCLCESTNESLNQILMKLDLKYNTKVQIQGIIDVDSFTEKLKLKVNSCHIVEGVKNITWIEEESSRFKTFYQNSDDGLTRNILNLKTSDITKRPIIRKPIILKNMYQTKNNILFQIEIDGIEYLNDLKGLVQDIAINPNIQRTDEKELLYVLKLFTAEASLQFKIPTQMVVSFPGIHLDKDENFVLIYPEKDKYNVIGEQDTQKELIKTLKAKEYDEEGKGYMKYYDFLNLSSIDISARLGVFGYTLPSSFFNAAKDELNSFPNLYIVGKNATFKTSTVEKLTEYTFGVPTLLGSNIDGESESRAMLYLMQSTLPVLFDEVNNLNVKVQNYLKAIGTKKAPNSRSNPNHKLTYFEPNCNFIATANDITWLNNDTSLREGRAIVIPLEIQTVSEELIQEYKRLDYEFKHSPLFGKFLLRTAIKFIKQSNPDSKKSDKQKFGDLIRETETKIRSYLKENKVKVTDSRRYTAYSILIIGLKMWLYLFFEKGIECEILGIYTDFNRPELAKLIEKLEIQNREIKLKPCREIRAFIKEAFNDCVDYGRGFIAYNNTYYLKQQFLGKYNDWAFKQKYSTYPGGLPELAKMINNLIDGRSITATSQYNGFGTEHCVEFPINELLPNEGIISNEGVLGTKIPNKKIKEYVLDGINKIKDIDPQTPILLEDLSVQMKIIDSKMPEETIRMGINELITDKVLREIKPNIWIKID